MNIDAAFESLKPELADRYIRTVRNYFDAIVEKFGPAARGVHNSYDAAGYRVYVAPNVNRVSENGIVHANAEIYIDEVKLALNAERHAEQAALAWRDKIVAKISDLENVEIKKFGGSNFLISGHRGGKAVAIDQNVITNVSPRGKLFNQFPARIYVDGKFTSEKKYHALFA
jgi:hypothetical protein